MKAVVMAGGEGTRLRPLTLSRPKPMVPICNRPVMEYVIDLLKRHGVDTIIVTLHYLAEDIVSYFGDGSDYGIHIIYSVEDEPLGTAGSVKKVEQYLDDTFLVISGDGLTDIDLGRVLAFHRDNKAKATLTLKRVENPLEYGVVITDDDGNIRRFLEKPSWGEVFSDQVNTGIYVLEPSVLKMMEPGKVYDFSGDIFPKLLADGEKLMGHVADGYWCDVGDIEHYCMANRDLFRGKVLHEMAGTEIKRGVWVGEGTKIAEDAVLEGPLLIGRHCSIGHGVTIKPYTIVGDNCIIEDEVALQRDIIFNNVFVGRKTRSGGAIIGRQCRLKSAVCISEGVVLGENVFVGQGAIIFQNVKVWPEKSIEDGALVSLNLVWGTLAMRSLFGMDGVSGLGNIEITPEFALKLGGAFGSTLPKGSLVVTSRDSHAAVRLINRALINGLTSVGVNVLDLRQVPVAVNRCAVCNNNSQGGIHTRVNRDDNRVVEIEFFDGRGINIEKSRERKIENIFVRQDFRRTYMDEVGYIAHSDQEVKRYIDNFIANIDVEAIRKAGFKMVVDYSYGSACTVLPQLLNTLGVEVISLSAYSDNAKAHQASVEHDKTLKQLADIVTPVGADLGVQVDLDAERLSVVDEHGQILQGNRIFALLALMMFRRHKDCLIGAPVTAPSMLDEIAANYGGKVIRTKTDSRSIMHTVAMSQNRIRFSGTPNGAFIFSEFSPGFDAMFAIAKLLEMMALEKKSVSSMAQGIPQSFACHGQVPCAWANRAKVMRLLVEKYRDYPTEMVDGVKVELPDGDLLFIPHPSLPRLDIWAEGCASQKTAELLQEAQETVKRLENANEDRFLERRATLEAVRSLSATLPEARAFHFWCPGRYLGIQARSMRTFLDVIHYIEASSLEYHMQRNDFANWLTTEFGQANLAGELRGIDLKKYKGEGLRNKILSCFGEGDILDDEEIVQNGGQNMSGANGAIPEHAVAGFSPVSLEKSASNAEK